MPKFLTRLYGEEVNRAPQTTINNPKDAIKNHLLIFIPGYNHLTRFLGILFGFVTKTFLKNYALTDVRICTGYMLISFEKISRN